MSLDERLFGFVHRALTRARAPRADPARAARAVSLDAQRPRLTALASALCDVRVDLVATDDDGAWQGDALFVPARMDDGATVDDNRALWRYRLAYAWALRDGGWFAPSEDSLVRRVSALLAVPAVELALHQRLPGAREIRERLAPQLLAGCAGAAGDHPLAAWARGLLGGPRSEFMDIEVRETGAIAEGVREACARLGRVRGALPPVCPLWGGLLPRRAGEGAEDETDAGAEALPTGSERQGRARDHLRVVRWEDDAKDENPLTHAFEKVETLEEYKGGRKTADGDDALAEHAEALDALDLREVIRTRERAGSLLRVDGMFEGAAGDLRDDGPPGAGAIPYDEWDERARAYRPGWCSVYAGAAPEGDPAAARARVQRVLREHPAQVERTRAALRALEQSRVWRGRQLDGPEVDLDAAVDRIACVRAGETPPARLYAARRRHRQDLAALLLLDASLSTDGWVAGRRVMDVARDAVILLGEALDGAGVELGVAAFSSNTRRDCRFAVLKGFAEPWSLGQRRLVALTPRGYTRIGPALRHATAVLAKADARRRLLVLLSDGRPTDFDRYEGRHGVADVRRAAGEAHERRITLFALAVESAARPHLAQMFGVDRHRVLRGPEGVADAMGEVLLRALR